MIYAFLGGFRLVYGTPLAAPPIPPSATTSPCSRELFILHDATLGLPNLFENMPVGRIRSHNPTETFLAALRRGYEIRDESHRRGWFTPNCSLHHLRTTKLKRCA